MFTTDARRFSLLTDGLLFYARQVSVMAFSKIQNLHIIARRIFCFNSLYTYFLFVLFRIDFNIFLSVKYFTTPIFIFIFQFYLRSISHVITHNIIHSILLFTKIRMEWLSTKNPLVSFRSS